MNYLQHSNIEHLLGIIAKSEMPNKSFGDVFDFLQKQASLVETGAGERYRAFFRLNHNPDYSISVEAKDGGLEPRSGRVQSAAVNYFQKHGIRKDVLTFAVPHSLKEPTQSLEKLFLNASTYQLGLDYVAGALQKAGFSYEADSVRGDRTATLAGEFSVNGQRVAVRVDLREVPLTQPSQFCRNWELQTSLKARLVYEQPRPEKKRAADSTYGPLFVPKAAIARP